MGPTGRDLTTPAPDTPALGGPVTRVVPPRVAGAAESLCAAHLTDARPCPSGLAAQSSAVCHLDDGRRVFLKWADAPGTTSGRRLLREARALRQVQGLIPTAGFIAVDASVGVLVTTALSGPAPDLTRVDHLAHAAEVCERLTALPTTLADHTRLWLSAPLPHRAQCVSAPGVAIGPRRADRLHCAARELVAMDHTALCHGDTHPGNWLLDGDTLALVDFDHLCLGPPHWDLAMTVAHSRAPVDQRAALLHHHLDAHRAATLHRHLDAHRAATLVAALLHRTAHMAGGQDPCDRAWALAELPAIADLDAHLHAQRS